MKSIRFLIAAGSLLLGGLRSVEAAPIYLTNTFDPVDVLFNRAGGSCIGTNGATDTVAGATGGSCDDLTFTHWLDGFNAVTDTLREASLTLTFHDDDDNSAEKFRFYVDLISGDGTVTSESVLGEPSRWVMDVLSMLEIISCPWASRPKLEISFSSSLSCRLRWIAQPWIRRRRRRQSRNRPQ